MGTTSEWMQVLEVGALYGILTLLWEAVTKRKRVARLLNLAAVALTSLLFGMMMVFEWRLLHGRVVVPFAVAILGLIVLGFAERRDRTRMEEVSSKAR
jgi:hypothetical protein